MNEENRILGKQEEGKSIDRLLKQAGKDKLIDAVVKGKTEQYQPKHDLPDFFNMFKPDGRAKDFITAVEKYGKFDEDTGMLKYDDDICSNSSAALALVYLIIGEKELGSKLIQRIEEHIGFDEKTGLVNHHNQDNDRIYTEDSALLALAYHACGMEEKALALIEKIEDKMHFKYFGDGGMLVEAEFNEDIISYLTEDSALLSLACFACEKGADALKLIKGIENHIGFHDDTELVKDQFVGSHQDSFAADNIALALAYFAAGREYDGWRLIEIVEEQIKFDERTGLVKTSLFLEDPEPHDSLMLTLAYMALDAWEDKK